MSSILSAAHTRTWLLSTPSTSYALRVGDVGLPVHLHWGVPLTLAQAASMAPYGPAHGIGDGHGHPEEYVVDGGPRFGLSSLQLRFPDGTRPVQPTLLGDKVEEADGAATLTLSYADEHYPLTLDLHYRVHDGCDVIERWCVLRHPSDPPALVTRLDSACWTLPPRPDYRLSHVTGHWGAESQLERVTVARAETTLTSRRGLTGHHANPWVMIDAGDATEDAGEVWSAALAWSGSWRITVDRSPTDRVQVLGGYGHDAVTWRLTGDDCLRTPVFSGLFSADGFGGASRGWHEHVRAHVLPRPDEVRPVVYNSWEATGFAVDEAGQQRLAALAAPLGVELFVMDDGWFGRRLDDNAGLGDWTPNPDRFPNGLTPLIDEVHRLGMRFGLWVEPEMVNPDSDLYRAYPDWVLHSANRARTELRQQLVLNFARPDVAEWAHGWLDGLLREHEIDFLKWDFNRPFTEAGWPSVGEDADRLWIDHVTGVYALLDRLRADHPRLRIESCAGGGGRVDLGILAHTDEVWTSDNTDAYDRLGIQYGFSQLYPAGIMAAWVTDSPNWLNGRAVPLRFRFHVAMAGVLAVGGNLTEWSPAELAEAASLVAQYKEIRPIVQHGRQYRLAPPGAPVTAVQYVAPDGDRSVVLAYRPFPTLGRLPQPLPLRGLDPTAVYRDDATGAEHPGALLLTRGLPLAFPSGDYASTAVTLTRL
ncbi:alpha-galactosidase [Luedemannella flava]|uniref:Alpha-galactosidase n=1 Tax=Luedemannella flava TaxID=349316 RepID=A0ABN2M915_9ACTN